MICIINISKLKNFRLISKEQRIKQTELFWELRKNHPNLSAKKIISIIIYVDDLYYKGQKY